MKTVSYERGIVSASEKRKPAVVAGMSLASITVVAALCFASLVPIGWLLKSALSTTQDTIQQPLAMFPSGIHPENIAIAWDRVGVGHYLLNTAWVALGSWLAGITVALTAGYVLAVLRPRYGPVLEGAILATLFIPGVISLVSLYMTVLDLPLLGWNLVNTFWAVWLPSAASAFNVLVVKRFFDAIPGELFEAARIDGAGPFRLFASIVLPMSRPIIGVISLLTVVSAWQDFLWPLLVLPDFAKQPISVALPRLASTTETSVLMAAMFLSVIIPVVLFLLFQKQFLRGAGQAGALKG